MKIYVKASNSVKSSSDIRYMDFKGRVPKKIKDATLEYMDTDGVSLADAFEWACREYAPKGSELWKAWYYNDFRKFIPSEYDPQYLDFKKYPLKYVKPVSSSSTIKASYGDDSVITEYAVEIYIRDDSPRGSHFWQQLDIYDTYEQAKNYCLANSLTEPDEFYVIRAIDYDAEEGFEVSTEIIEELD